MLRTPVVSSIIVGASKIHQLDDNLKAVDVHLSDSDVALLDELSKTAPMYPHWFNQQLIDPVKKGILG